jgi:hypothetical protein
LSQLVRSPHAKKMENFRGCPLFPQWLFSLSRPGQMEYLTIVSHMSKLHPTRRYKRAWLPQHNNSRFCRKRICQGIYFFIIAHVVISKHNIILVIIIIIIII